jgi:hypothetical protein
MTYGRSVQSALNRENADTMDQIPRPSYVSAMQHHLEKVFGH